MSRNTNQFICLLGKSASCTSLFDQQKDVEYFQLRLGLGALCQNTLIYQSVDEKGKRIYKTIISPHANDFFCEDCLVFRASEESCGDASCDALLSSIVRYFCESDASFLPKDLDFKILKYPNHIQSQFGKTFVFSGNYIQYRCPFVNCYKFGFPIYVNGDVIAVLFTGQFFLLEKDEKVDPESSWTLWGQNIFRIENFQQHTPNFSHSNCIKEKTFDCIDDLLKFVNEEIIPIVKDFTFTAQNNFELKQIERICSLIENARSELDKQFITFLNQYFQNFVQTNAQADALSRFWILVKDSLDCCLENCEIDSLYVFMALPSTVVSNLAKLSGIALREQTKMRSEIVFNYALAQEAMTSDSVAYSTSINQDKSNLYLFNYVHTDTPFIPSLREIIVDATALPPFAIVYEFCNNSEVARRGDIRYNIQIQLDHFFQKVGQLLSYLFIRLSEHEINTVLRIYRHEITHQVSALDQNLWELEPAKFKLLDERKLERIISDHRQCLFVLDFMTHNIDVITGRISQRVINFDQDHPIDVAADIFNKAIGLNQAIKNEKYLWFDVHNNSLQKYFSGCLELLDMIFFNLMSNATKYAYEGTKIILEFGDTNYHGRPHYLSVTDFGCGIKTKNQSQLFQIYYREKNVVATEGSGIGLYVAGKVAELLGATLTWKCEWVSDYHVPSLARFLVFEKNQRRASDEEIIKANDEYIRLTNAGKWNLVLNKGYLSRDLEWDYREVKGRLKYGTYQVTFWLEF